MLLIRLQCIYVPYSNYITNINCNNISYPLYAGGETTDYAWLRNSTKIFESTLTANQIAEIDLSEIEFIGDKALGRKVVEECKTLYNKTNVVYIFNEYFPKNYQEI